MILVDTDLWIDFFAGSDPGASAVEGLLHQRRAVLSVITIFELFCGVAKKRQAEQLEELVRLVPSLELTVEASRQAGRYYLGLRKDGSLIGNQDLLLAGTASEYQLPILTRNRRHFERIADLEVLSPEQLLASDNDSQ